MIEDNSIGAVLQRESVDEALGYILAALDIIAALALKEDTYDEVADEELRLGMIISRAQLILSFLDAGKPVQLRRAN